MPDIDVALVISFIALTVSIGTFWLTFFWGGKLKYSEPSQVWMGFSSDGRRAPLIFFRFYSHSTGLAGNLIGSLHLEVKRGQVRQDFNIWLANTGSGYKSLAGLKVMRDGISLENIFQPDCSDREFNFLPGKYELNLFSEEIKKNLPTLISSPAFDLTENDCELIQAGKYIVFTKKADGTGYTSYSEDPAVDPNKVLVNDMVEKMVSELDKRDTRESDGADG